MSWEGYSEHLCEKGHHFTVSQWDDVPSVCDICGGKLSDENTVDQTNDSGFRWNLEEIGFDKIECKSEFDEVYHVKQLKYKIIGMITPNETKISMKEYDDYLDNDNPESYSLYEKYCKDKTDE